MIFMPFSSNLSYSSLSAQHHTHASRITIVKRVSYAFMRALKLHVNMISINCGAFWLRTKLKHHTSGYYFNKDIASATSPNTDDFSAPDWSWVEKEREMAEGAKWGWVAMCVVAHRKSRPICELWLLIVWVAGGGLHHRGTHSTSIYLEETLALWTCLLQCLGPTYIQHKYV